MNALNIWDVYQSLVLHVMHLCKNKILQIWGPYNFKHPHNMWQRNPKIIDAIYRIYFTNSNIWHLNMYPQTLAKKNKSKTGVMQIKCFEVLRKKQGLWLKIKSKTEVQNLIIELEDKL